MAKNLWASISHTKHSASKKGAKHEVKPAAKPEPCPLSNHQRVVAMRAARRGLSIVEYERSLELLKESV